MLVREKKKEKKKFDLIALATELQRQSETKEDYNVRSENIIIVVDKNTGTLKMDIPIPDNRYEGDKGETRREFPITDYCLGQIADDKTPVGLRYFREMMKAGFHDLVRDNFQAWLHQNKDQLRMVRLLDTKGDGVVRMRALLSDGYRSIDNYDVLKHAMTLTKSMNMDIYFQDVQLSETRLYIKAVSKRLVDNIFTLKGQDTVEGGVIIMNSEVGAGKYKVIPFMNVVRCTNGLIGEEAFTQIHLGLKKGEGLINWSDETLQKSDEALWLQISDVVRHTFDKEIFRSWVDRINGVSSIELKQPTIAVNNVVRQFKIPKSKVEDLLLYFGAEEKTLWGLSNAVTRMAQDEENYDTRVEYEETGRRILELKPEAIVTP